MAKKIIYAEVVIDSAQAAKNTEELSEQLQIQRQVLIDLEKQLYEVEEAQKATSKTNLSAQKKLADQAKVLKSEIKSEKIGLKDLNAQKKLNTITTRNLSKAQANSGQILLGVDEFTGGYASRLKDVYRGLIQSAKGVKTFVKGLSGMKKALVATGVGALVVGLGLVVAYWDEIKGLVNGVSSEQSNVLDATNKTLDSQREQLDITSSMESTLKLQGASEREIRDLKMQQTNEVIASTELLLEQQRAIKKSQIEAAERNQKITMGIIGFLTSPITILLGAIDALTYGLEKVGVLEEGTKLAESYLEGTSKLLFDPDETAKEGDAVIVETENILRKLKNTRDAFRLERIAEDAADELERKKELNAAVNIPLKGFDLVSKTIDDNNKILMSNRKLSVDVRKVKRKDLDDTLAIEQAKLDSAIQGINAIQNITNAFTKGNEKSQKRAFEVTKKLQIAQTIIETYKGATAIFSAAALNPGSILFPAQPFIAAGAAIAAGLANVATIRKQKFSGGGGGGGGGGGVGGGGSFSGKPSGGLADNFFPTQIGAIPQNVPDINATPPRAYIVASDISDSTRAQEILKQKSTM